MPVFSFTTLSKKMLNPYNPQLPSHHSKRRNHFLHFVIKTVSDELQHKPHIAEDTEFKLSTRKKKKRKKII